MYPVNHTSIPTYNSCGSSLSSASSSSQDFFDDVTLEEFALEMQPINIHESSSSSIKDSMPISYAFYHNGFDPSFTPQGLHYLGRRYPLDGFSYDAETKIFSFDGEEILMNTEPSTLSSIMDTDNKAQNLRKLIIGCKKGERAWAMQSYLSFVVKEEMLLASSNMDIIKVPRFDNTRFRALKDAFFNDISNLYQELFEVSNLEREQIPRPFPGELISVIDMLFRVLNPNISDEEAKEFLRKDDMGLCEDEGFWKTIKDNEKQTAVEQRIKQHILLLKDVEEPAQHLIEMCRNMRHCIRQVRIEEVNSATSYAELVKIMRLCKESLAELNQAWIAFVNSNDILHRHHDLFAARNYPQYITNDNWVPRPYFAFNGFDPCFSEDGLEYLSHRKRLEEGNTLSRVLSIVSTTLSPIHKLILECKNAERELADLSKLAFVISEQELSDKKTRLESETAHKHLLKPQEDTFFTYVGELYKAFFPQFPHPLRPFPREVLEAIHMAFAPQAKYIPNKINGDLARGMNVGFYEMGETNEESLITQQTELLNAMTEPAKRLVKMCRAFRNTLCKYEDSIFSSVGMKYCKEALRLFGKSWQTFTKSHPMLERNQSLFSQKHYFERFYSMLRQHSEVPSLKAHVNDLIYSPLSNKRTAQLEEWLMSTSQIKSQEINDALVEGARQLRADSLATRSHLLRVMTQNMPAVAFDTIQSLKELQARLHIFCQAEREHWVTLQNAEGMTPLALTVIADIPTDKKIKVIDYLIKECKANPNIGDKKKQTPLHKAVGGNHTEVLKFLLDHKANPNCADFQNSVPLHLAVEQENEECVCLLLNHQADVNRLNYFGSPLAYAVKSGNVRIVSLLLEHKADRNLVFNLLDDSTPLEIAAAYGHSGIVELLSRGPVM